MIFTRTVVDQWWSDVIWDDGMPIGPVPHLQPGQEHAPHVGPGRWQRHLIVDMEHEGSRSQTDCWLIRDAMRPDRQEHAFLALEARLLGELTGLPI